MAPEQPLSRVQKTSLTGPLSDAAYQNTQLAEPVSIRDTQKMDNLHKAMEHFAKAISLLALEGMQEVSGNVSFIPAAFDAANAAKYIGIGVTKLEEYRNPKDGSTPRIKTHTVGGRPKYYRKDLDRLLAEIARE